MTVFSKLVKVISFSLWGDNTRYTLGALQNASLAKMVYPDWICRFYVGHSTPRIVVDMLKSPKYKARLNAVSQLAVDTKKDVEVKLKADLLLQ